MDRRHYKIDWGLQPLGQVPDEDLAERLGVPAARVRTARRGRGILMAGATRPRGIDWDAQPLGTVSDATLAANLGVGVSTVKGARWCREIPAGVRPRVEVDWDAQPLGKVSDCALARQLGCSPGTVGRARRARGIPPCEGCYSPNPLASASRSATLGTVAGDSENRSTLSGSAAGAPG